MTAAAERRCAAAAHFGRMLIPRLRSIAQDDDDDEEEEDLDEDEQKGGGTCRLRLRAALYS